MRRNKNLSLGRFLAFLASIPFLLWFFFIASIFVQSKINLYTINNTLVAADEFCVISSYLVNTDNNQSFVTLNGRSIQIEKWNIGDSEDAIFIAVLLKDGKFIKSKFLLKSEVEILKEYNANQWEYGDPDTYCFKRKI